MKKSKVVFLVAAVSFALSSMAQDRETVASNATDFTLLCSANAYGQRLNKILVVDLSKKTVNSAKAAVTENMITWSTTDYSDITKGNRINRHELNRLAGSYQSWTVGATYPGPPPDFSCSKAPAAKF